VNPNRPEVVPVNLKELETHFDAGERVSPKELVTKGLVRARSGRLPQVKILGVGKLTKKVSIANCSVSASAREAITKAGGEVLQ
jgi:large subunit ribosomal protein L15